MTARAAAVLALLCAAAAPGAAAEGAGVCGQVEILGRPMPAGFISLLPQVPSPAPVDKSLHRIGDGKFCIPGVAPGDYFLSVMPALVPSPQDNELLPSPLPISFRGLSQACDECRITVDGAGHAAVSDGQGRYAPVRTPLDIVYRAPAKSPSTILLKGRLKAAAGEPVFFFVRTDQTAPAWTTTDHFAWLEGGAEFSVPIVPGRMLNLWARSGDLTAVGLRYAKPLNPLGPASPLMEITLGRSGKITGQVTAADGARFRPHLGRDVKARRLFAVRTSTFWEDDHGDGAFADSEGRYEATHLRPGFYRLWPVTGAAGFEESVGRPRAAWVEAGSNLTIDWTLSPWAMVRIAPEGAGRAAPVGGFPPGANTVPLNLGYPRERWIVGVKPGALDETGVSGLLLGDETPISFIQDREGGWVPRRPWDRRRPSAGVRVEPGRYDVYRLEVADRFGRPSLRVSGLESGVAVREGQEAAMTFSAPPYPSGSGALRGELKASHGPSLERFRRGLSLAELHALLTPRVQLYDADGRFMGAAFAGITYVELGEIIAAAGGGDERAFDAAVRRRSPEFVIEGLAAGRYDAVLSASGYPAHRMTLDIRSGATTRLAADLDLERFDVQPK